MALGTYVNPEAPGACRADPNNNNVESNEANNDCTDTVTVNRANTTATITSDLPDPSVVGQSVPVNYSVSVDAPGGGTPTGNVTVSDGTDSCTASVAAGTCNITFSSAGSKSLTATYGGDTNFNASPASSPATPHTVNQAGTTTSITSDVPDTSVVGQSVPVNYSVTVNAPGGGTPAGNVTVSDGVDSCTATVAAATCNITLTTSGHRTLTATYVGDTNFITSTSAGEPHTVNAPVPDHTPPVTSNVMVVLHVGGQVDSSPVVVSWTASDNVTPAANLVHDIQIRHRANNVWGQWQAYATVTGSQTMVALPLWRPFEFRVRTRDQAGNLSNWAQSSALTLLRRDESNFHRSANWTRQAVAGAMRGHVLASSTVGAWARLRFFGDAVAVVMTASSGMGSVNVCLDPGTAGEHCQSVNLGSFSPNGQRRLVAVFTGFAYGKHYLRVTVTSGHVELDGAIIDYPTWG